MNYFLRNCNSLMEITLGGTFAFKSKDIGLVSGYWDETSTADPENLPTSDLIENSPEGTWVFASSDYSVILYDDGELVFQRGDEVDEGRTVVGKYMIYSGSTVPGWNSHAADITKVTFKDEIEAPSTYMWFNGCTNLTKMKYTDWKNWIQAKPQRWHICSRTAVLWRIST